MPTDDRNPDVPPLFEPADQYLERQRKLREIVALGYDPYPHRFDSTHTVPEVVAQFATASTESLSASQPRVRVAGRIFSIRFHGKTGFADLHAGPAPVGRLQCYLRRDQVGEKAFRLFELLDLGDIIGVEGHVGRTKTGELTLFAENLGLLAKALLPLPEKWHGLADVEQRYRQRYLDLLVNPGVREIFQTRARIIGFVRRFLEARGFVEVETPILQPLYGGAAARPFITHHNQLKQDLYLRIAFELYLKRLLVGNLERVYEIGRDFRNEGVDRTHNPEFTMLEFYWAYADYLQVMEFTEQMIVFVADQVLGRRAFTYQGNQISLEPPWRRVELRQALLETSGINIEQYAAAEGLAAEMRQRGLQPDPQATRGKLIEALMSEYLEPTLIQPTILYNYPRDVSPLAKSMPGNPGIVERFEAFVAGFELCNAFTELNDPLDQEARFREMGRDYAADDEERHPMDEDYLRAMRYGMPPNGGFGMGIDRLTMLLTDSANIREVILFPHLRERD